MTAEPKDAIIKNAAEIISRFGGIRPMSAKTGIPVTTIQGWKQRNAIPATRRFELVEAANKNGISLSDLMMDIAGVGTAMTDETDQTEEVIMRVNTKKTNLAQERNPDLRPAGNQTTILAAGALVLVSAVLGVVLAFAPKVQNITDQDKRIRELEQQIAAMHTAQKEEAATRPIELPPELNAKLSELEGKVGQLAAQAQTYSAIATDIQTGTVAQRISKLEGHMGGLLQQANAQGLQQLLQKFTLMQGSAQGEGQMDQLVSAFLGATSANGATDDLTATFTQLRETNPQVAETFKDVAPEDMKAAVMLLGMSQLRDSLARDNKSFDNDLQLLKATLAKDDPVLSNAIDRLAPKAKSGVLTTSGLSNELRGLTGDIVAASLSGQEVSLEEKAKARFGDILKVEKNGAQLSGTQTQITIAEAQKKLDAGDVEGAITLLRQVQGPAAEKTKPVIDAAQATLLASEVQNLLGQNILQKLKGMAGGSAPYIVNGGGAGQIIDQINSMGTQLGQ